MTTPLNPAQKLQAERLNYPGMLPAEILIFRNWLKVNEAEYDRLEYNVRIGQGSDPGPAFDDTLRKMWTDNTKKRIDALAYKDNAVTIIEVKRRAGLAAFGQLMGYEVLWKQERGAFPAPRLLMVTDRLADDVMPVILAHGIAVDLVATDFGLLATSPGRIPL